MILRSPIHAAVSSALLLLAACGGSSAEGPPPDDATTQTTAAKPAPPPEKAPDAAAKPTADPKAAPAPADNADKKPAASTEDADGPDGIRRWAGFNGPKTGTAITTKKAWVFAPNLSGDDDKMSFRSVTLTLVDVVKADANEVIFDLRKIKYGVPASTARPAEAPKGLKKGSVARCSFASSSAVARIDAADPKSVTCAFRFMDQTEKKKLTPEEIFPLSGKLEMGAPAIVKFDGDNDAYAGTVVAANGDDAWVTVETQFATEGDPRKGKFVHKVKAANVTVFEMKPLKVGDACLATNIGSLSPGKVSKVIDGGLAYMVKFEDGSESRRELLFDQVAPAPKGAAKKPAP